MFCDETKFKSKLFVFFGFGDQLGPKWDPMVAHWCPNGPGASGEVDKQRFRSSLSFCAARLFVFHTILFAQMCHTCVTIYWQITCQ